LTPTSSQRIHKLRREFVDSLISDGYLQDPSIAAAFRRVPRHPFLPGIAVEHVYSRAAIPVRGRTSSVITASTPAPLMASMLEALHPTPGDRVLEVGTGTGYNAALLADLVRPGEAVSVEMCREAVEIARRGLEAASVRGVVVVEGDGALGYPDLAPYDGIIVTAGCWDIAKAWIDQLKTGGRLVLPVAIRGVELLVTFRKRDEALSSERVSAYGVSLWMVQGRLGGLGTDVTLPSEGLVLSSEADGISKPQLQQWLRTEPHEMDTQVRLTYREFWHDLRPWLALHEPNCCQVSREPAMTSQPPASPTRLAVQNAMRSTFGVLDDCGLALVVPSQAEVLASAATDRTVSLHVASFGPRLEPALRLQRQIARWAEFGRPSLDSLHVVACPRAGSGNVSFGDIAIVRRDSLLSFGWDQA
jgi:protein-L-isoaspartate(D-aspartate) O-methyltransferase